MTIKSELLTLQKKAGGLLQAEQVVQWAQKNPKSEIAASLEWDNTEAAHQWRIWQVRRLIAIHVVSVQGVREMVSLTIDRTNRHGGGYRGLHSVIMNKTLRDVLLADALAELERVRLKFESLKELAEVWLATSKVRRKIGGKAGKSKQSVAKRIVAKRGVSKPAKRRAA